MKAVNPTKVAVSRKIEVFENERYIPLSGWGSKGLLISDRSAYSTKDGSSNFSNIDEATSQLISDGMILNSLCTILLHFRLTCRSFQNMHKVNCAPQKKFTIYSL